MFGLSPHNPGRATRLWVAQDLFSRMELNIFTQKEIIAVQRKTNHFRQSCYATMMYRPLQSHICETSIIYVTNTVLTKVPLWDT